MIRTASHNSRTAPGAFPAQSGSLEARALALRDFFISANAAGLERACRAIAHSFGALSGLPMPSPKNPSGLPSTPEGWAEVEYAFNRLFVGPGPVPAPLYASIYLDPEPRLMGTATADIRSLMRELDLCLPNEGKEPEDHISYELELWCVLARLAMDTHDEPELAKGLVNARQWLEREHLERWIPLFINRAEAQKPEPVIRMVLMCLDHWLMQCRQRREYEQQSAQLQSTERL